MLVITSGNLDTVKEEMKAMSKELTDQAKALRKKYKPRERSNEINNKLKEFDRLQMFYKVSRVSPVRVENIIINYKAYEKFMKKLVGYTCSAYVSARCLTIEYSNQNSKGVFTLHDLSDHYANFQYLPIAELTDVEGWSA